METEFTKRSQDALLSLQKAFPTEAHQLDRFLCLVTETVASVLGARRTFIWSCCFESGLYNIPDVFVVESGTHRRLMGSLGEKETFCGAFDCDNRRYATFSRTCGTSVLCEGCGAAASQLCSHVLLSPIRQGAQKRGCLVTEGVPGRERIWSAPEAVFQACVADLVSHVFAVVEGRDQQEGMRAVLRESERAAILAESIAHVGTWEMEPSVGVIKASQECLRMLGKEPGTPLVLADFLQCVCIEDHPKLRYSLENMLFLGQSSTVDVRLLSPDDECRTVELQVISLKTDENFHKHILGTLADVTEKRKAEKLRLERDAAEEANKAKSAFLANMSHEIRTPLHGILSYARFGMTRATSASPEKLFEYFAEIHESGSRLLTLLNDLLDLSKLEAGKMAYSFEKLDLIDSCSIVCGEFRSLLEEKSLNLVFASPLSSAAIRADSQRILQVLRNILNNAVKFSENNGEIRLSLKRVQCLSEVENVKATKIPCPFFEIAVTNTGVGIPADELELIFEKFAQSSKTRSGAGGTGLGLAICREIVMAHKGHIWAECGTDRTTKLLLGLPEYNETGETL